MRVAITGRGVTTMMNLLWDVSSIITKWENYSFDISCHLPERNLIEPVLYKEKKVKQILSRRKMYRQSVTRGK